MRGLLELDKAQLARIEGAIAMLASRPVAEQVKKIHLLQALKSEKQELVRDNPALRAAARIRAA